MIYLLPTRENSSLKDHQEKFLGIYVFVTLPLENKLSPLEIPQTKKKLYDPFLWTGFNCLKATAISRRKFTCYHSVASNSRYSFYQPRKDERLSRPRSHPVDLNTGPLDWESSALTTSPLCYTSWKSQDQKSKNNGKST